MPRIAIVGAGVIGLACAYRLRRLGAEVEVLDAGRPGAACSLGNAGWITPSLATPLAAPGVIGQSLRWLASGRGPLYIRPSTVVAAPGWFRRFWRESNEPAYVRGRAALAGLTSRAMALLDALRNEGIPFDMHEQGLLYVFRREEAARHVMTELRALQDYGFAAPRPVEGDLREWEPGLRGDIRRGILVEGERHVRPETLTAGLAGWLRDHGVVVRTGFRVSAFQAGSGRVHGLHGPEGQVIEADHVLLAAGVWTGGLARLLGFRLPMQGGKGYTITLTDPQLRLRRPLYLDDVKVACSPFEDALRLAGTVELAGLDGRLDPRRVHRLAEDISLYLRDWRPARREEHWTGLRPMTPDGLPAIGRAPGYENVWVATGHAMLGVTLAAPTAWAMADLILSVASGVALDAFDPGRFG